MAGPSPTSPPVSPPAPQQWGEFPSASFLIGQTGFEDVAPPGTPGRMLRPQGSLGVSVDRKLFYQGSSFNLHVYLDYEALHSPEQAPDFSLPLGEQGTGAAVSNGRLVVNIGNVVRLYDGVPDGVTEPDYAIAGTVVDSRCRADEMNISRSAHITPQGQLVVADALHNRVLIWNAVPASGPMSNANTVVGQQLMTQCVANDVNQNGLVDDVGVNGHVLNRPAAVWSDGVKLIVADTDNHRVLIWDKLPTTPFQPADHVVGQATLNDSAPNAGLGRPAAWTLLEPFAVDVSETGQLAVADGNHRVLIWNSIPDRDGQLADHVLGQPNFESGAPNAGGSPGARTLNLPRGLRFHGRNLIVADTLNDRLMVWRPQN